ncbi:hypothetical protein AMTR_s00005p00247900 [Amborella trichopoda]|uniref:Uncharacterized protein n=1 Tax=Amborella trichopoda TaxID=13333 RepID=W1PFZ5_AMBTC|nr:hypothetical protein AMTR_s00005p00247900 [Amborella trichopoda]
MMEDVAGVSLTRVEQVESDNGLDMEDICCLAFAPRSNHGTCETIPNLKFGPILEGLNEISSITPYPPIQLKEKFEWNKILPLNIMQEGCQEIDIGVASNEETIMNFYMFT